MQQHNQVFVIQVSSDASSPKSPLPALPSPPGGPESAVLPSEVKYSASLVKGLGLAHLFLGFVLFLLGVLGTWIEPETCWAGAGVWTGLAALLCGLSGVVAHYFWYKNFSIKAFLVTSVVCVVLSVLAIILSIYAIVNRHKHFQVLLENKDEHSWFQPYDLNKEHRLSVNISANLLVGFILEVCLALWSSRVSWRGVQTPEFSASKRDNEPVTDQADVTPLPPAQRHNQQQQQVPLAALYQLLQTHPEMLSNKSMEGGLSPPWISSMSDHHPTHHSMDYHERVNRFLSNAIEDQNTCMSRPLSALLSEARDTGSSSNTASTSSEGRCSPADTLPLPPPETGQKVLVVAERETRERHASSERKSKQIQNVVNEMGNQRVEVDQRERRASHTSSERKSKPAHPEMQIKRDVSTDGKLKQTHTDKLPNGHTGTEGKIKEIHVDAQSSGVIKSSRKTKTQVPGEQSKRKVKDAHIGDSVRQPQTTEVKVREIYEDTDEDSAVSIQKVKVTHVDRLSIDVPPTKSERRGKETQDRVINRDLSTERRVKDAHTDRISSREPSTERKVRDKMMHRDISTERKGRETHRELSRDRKGKETETDTVSNQGTERKGIETQADRHGESSRKVKKKGSDTSSMGNVKITHVDAIYNNEDIESRSKVKVTHVDTLSSVDSGSSAGKVKDLDDTTKRRRRLGSDHKPRAPAPKIRRSESFKSDKSSANEFMNSVTITIKKDELNSEVQSEITPVTYKEKNNKEETTRLANEETDLNIQRKKAEKAEKPKKKKTKRAVESNEQEIKPQSNAEETNIKITENTSKDQEERKVRKERKEKRKKESKGDDERSKDKTKSPEITSLASNLAPPCEFQDN